jgi:hypothetical protein
MASSLLVKELHAPLFGRDDEAAVNFQGKKSFKTKFVDIA